MTAGKQLLVIDDEPDFAELVAVVGRKMGFGVEIMSSTRGFAERLSATHPDVIVLDILMPEHDGIEVIRWLVENGCQARIIIVSGYHPLYASAARLIAESGGKLKVCQLQKPVKLADLRVCLAGESCRPATSGIDGVGPMTCRP